MKRSANSACSVKCSKSTHGATQLSYIWKHVFWSHQPKGPAIWRAAQTGRHIRIWTGQKSEMLRMGDPEEHGPLAANTASSGAPIAGRCFPPWQQPLTWHASRCMMGPPPMRSLRAGWRPPFLTAPALCPLDWAQTQCTDPATAMHCET